MVITDETGCGIDCILMVRRYRCTKCKHTFTVTPQGISKSRYDMATITLALYYWAIERLSEINVRRKIATNRRYGHGTLHKWPVLRRWSKRMFSLMPPERQCYTETFRDQAALIVRWVAAQAPPDFTDASLREQLLVAACSLAF